MTMPNTAHRYDEIVASIDTLGPYCDVISAHLADVIANNARAAITAIEGITAVDRIAIEVRDDAVALATSARRALEQARTARVEAAEAGVLDAETPEVAEAIVGAVDPAMEALELLVKHTEEAATLASNRVDRLSNRATAVVTEMQFEDIGRQLIDHVRAAIGDMREHLEQLSEYLRGDLTPEAVLASLCAVAELRRLHVHNLHRVAQALAIGVMPEVVDRRAAGVLQEVVDRRAIEA